jgi:hypothetical protein
MCLSPLLHVAHQQKYPLFPAGPLLPWRALLKCAHRRLFFSVIQRTVDEYTGLDFKCIHT